MGDAKSRLRFCVRLFNVSVAIKCYGFPYIQPLFFFFAVVVVFIFQRFSQQLTQGRNVTQGHERYTLHQVWGVETQTYSELGVKRYVIFELTGFGYEWTDGRTDGRMDGWTDGWMDGW